MFDCLLLVLAEQYQGLGGVWLLTISQEYVASAEQNKTNVGDDYVQLNIQHLQV